MGGFACSKGPRPRAPFSRRRPRRPFFHRVRNPCMTGHHVDLVAFHVPRQDRFRRAGDDPVPERVSHPLDSVRMQAQRVGDLRVR